MKQFVVSLIEADGQTLRTQEQRLGKVLSATQQLVPSSSSPEHCVSLSVELLTSSARAASSSAASSGSSASLPAIE